MLDGIGILPTSLYVAWNFPLVMEAFYANRLPDAGWHQSLPGRTKI